MSEKPAKPIEVFYSYSHKDEELRDELEKHLSILKRQGVIAGWHDRRIGAGRDWAGEIDTHLNAADVILLLISADKHGVSAGNAGIGESKVIYVRWGPAVAELIAIEIVRRVSRNSAGGPILAGGRSRRKRICKNRLVGKVNPIG